MKIKCFQATNSYVILHSFIRFLLVLQNQKCRYKTVLNDTVNFYFYTFGKLNDERFRKLIYAILLSMFLWSLIFSYIDL